MKKTSIAFLCFFLLATATPLYAFKIGDAELNNDLSFYYDIRGQAARLFRFTWIGIWKYKHLFFFKPIYRADFNRDLNDTPFYIFTPDFGVYLYKNIALRYQHEEIRTHTRRISRREIERVGLSLDVKGTYFKKKLFWMHDIQFYGFETEGDQRFRMVNQFKYKKLTVNLITFVDFHDWVYQNISTISYSLYKNKNYGLSFKFQFYKQKEKERVYRLGLGVDF